MSNWTSIAVDVDLHWCPLEPLPKAVHDAFHSGLDKILPCPAGKKYYGRSSNAESPRHTQQPLETLGIKPMLEALKEDGPHFGLWIVERREGVLETLG